MTNNTPKNLPIHMAAPMLGYQCNQKGCCCQSWGITFKTSDLARLVSNLPEDERNRVGEGLELIVDADTNTVTNVRLRKVGPERRCLFLEDGGGCEVHRRFGTKPLPDLCLTFPVVAYDAGDRIEYHLEALCPSVLDELARPDIPYTEIILDEDQLPHWIDRSRTLMPYPKTKLGDVVLTQAQMRGIRDIALEALRDTGRPAVEHLAAMCFSFDRMRASGDPDSFEVSYDDEIEPFFDYLEWCARTHNAHVICTLWERYKRFVWGVDHDDPRFVNLEYYVENWAEPLMTWMVPQESVLRSFFVRYLSHRYHSLFTRVQGNLILSYGSAPHVYALEQPTDLEIAKASVGFADYVYRNIHVPETSMPWFTPFSNPEQVWSMPLSVEPEEGQM